MKNAFKMKDWAFSEHRVILYEVFRSRQKLDLDLIFSDYSSIWQNFQLNTISDFVMKSLSLNIVTDINVLFTKI